MKWSKPVKERFCRNYYITALKNGYRASVKYIDNSKYFFFVVDNEITRFNSLWENMAFRTEEECKAACEKWIDENGDGGLNEVKSIDTQNKN